MRFPLPKKPRHWLALAVVAPTLIILFLISGVFQWSPLNCRYEDVDINSGRARYTRYLLCCQVNERVEDTWVSRNATDVGNLPDWRRVNTFSPGVHYSPHYGYHGALQQINTLEVIDNTIPLEPDARRKVADALLALWQNTGSDFRAGDYVQKVGGVALSLDDNGASVVTAADIPDK
jgi:hypothetical protein